MRRLVPLAAPLVAALLLLPVPARAWGFTAHKYIVSRAIDLLPAAIRPFFDEYRTTIVEHAIDPDTYRTVGWLAESPRHYVDMDAYGPFPFTALPHDYDAAVAKFGKDTIEKNGTLPWRLQDMQDRLIEAFGQTSPYARDDIKLFSSVATHYLADAFQPLHATLNHDGQLTGQRGIHARFETELFERYQARLHITPGPLVPVPNAREFAFATLADSQQLVAPILAADRAAAAGRDEYDDQYFDALLARTQPLLEKRLGQAITGVASLITAAWDAAGRPALPVDAPPRVPRKIRHDGR
ncbi:MAG TPA: zinc dependent phospholipase C family protein [Vicinamibacterales bacterium]|nr:zinc dependent phospholipase C family protein [Vicinamibacterales bacterium]